MVIADIYQPISCYWLLSIPPEHMKKTYVGILMF